MLSSVQHALESGRYPQWIQDVVMETEDSANAVAHHEAWYRFSDATIPQEKHHALLIGFWPLIERFPQFLALNLLKCAYGEDTALNKARGWLIKNLRVEQRHAELYRDWAVSAGIPQETLFSAKQSVAARAITDWSWQVCESGDLAEGMVATNYAIEGVTGAWTQMVWESPGYKLLFKEGERKKALKWIQAHAAYDDKHPVEALVIVSSLLGKDPGPAAMLKVKVAIQKSYELYLLALDSVMATA